MKEKLPPIAKHFALYMAQQAERERSQRERRLPDNLPVRHSEPPITEKQKETTALAYLLADVIYQIMFDLCEQMQSGGSDLRHESKYRFNELFKAAQNFRDRASRVSQDVAVMKSDRAFDDFFEDSEWLRETIELLFNRALATEDAKVRIQALLFNLPQR